MRIVKSLLTLIGLFLKINSYCQDAAPAESALKLGMGIGINEGKKEIGMGALFSFGYQKSFWKDNRLRINPNLTIGGFMPFPITDTRDQYYRITSLGIHGYLDAIKFKSIALFIGAGPFINYSRGLLGTGGSAGYSNSEYFFRLYYGGYAGTGIRVYPKNSRFAYEFVPLNILAGNNSFVLGFIKIGIDIKLTAIAAKE